MREMHVFEIVGDVLFRPSGNAGFRAVPCKIIQTRARRQPDGTVLFAELTTGHERYTFPVWFSDRFEQDNGLQRDYQAGRPVRIAVPVTDFELMLGDGRPISRSFRPELERAQRHHDMVQSPIAAVYIDGRWVFPDPPTTHHVR